MRLRQRRRAGRGALQRAELAPQFGDGLVDVVELGPRGIAVHLAVELGDCALGKPEVGRGLQHLALGFQEGVGALRLQQDLVGRLAPERQERPHRVERRLAVLDPCVQPLGEGAGRPRPGIEHDLVVLEAALAQPDPGVEHLGELTLHVPQIGKAWPFRHALERLVDLVRRRHPAARIEDPRQHGRDDRIGGAGPIAALHPLVKEDERSCAADQDCSKERRASSKPLLSGT